MTCIPMLVATSDPICRFTVLIGPQVTPEAKTAHSANRLPLISWLGKFKDERSTLVVETGWAKIRKPYEPVSTKI